MFLEGDEVFVTNLAESVQDMLCDVLETEFSQIEFFFIEYHNTDYAVLSAETEYKFAILHCPLHAIDGVYDDAALADELIDHVLNTLVLDHALDTRNEELFHAILSYNASKSAQRLEDVPDHLYMHLITDLGYEEFDPMLGDGF